MRVSLGFAATVSTAGVVVVTKSIRIDFPVNSFIADSILAFRSGLEHKVVLYAVSYTHLTLPTKA